MHSAIEADQLADTNSDAEGVDSEVSLGKLAAVVEHARSVMAGAGWDDLTADDTGAVDVDGGHSNLCSADIDPKHRAHNANDRRWSTVAFAIQV